MLNILALSAWFLFHPVHVTLTSIDLAGGTDSMKVFVRMYYDDFLRDYRLFDSTSIPNDAAEGKKPFPEPLLNNYLNKKVNIRINNKLLTGKLLNQTLIDNEISMNLLFMAVKKPKVISVRNLILTEMYADQSNMTMIRINDFEEGVKLTPENNTVTYKLN
jgi:hypothetical protein